MLKLHNDLLRSVDLWIKGCVKSRAFLLRRRACFPSPSARILARRQTFLSTNSSTSVLILIRIYRRRWARTLFSLENTIANDLVARRTRLSLDVVVRGALTLEHAMQTSSRHPFPFLSSAHFPRLLSRGRYLSSANSWFCWCGSRELIRRTEASLAPWDHCSLRSHSTRPAPKMPPGHSGFREGGTKSKYFFANFLWS